MAQVFVGDDHEIQSINFGAIEQLALANAAPADLNNGIHVVTCKRVPTELEQIRLEDL